MGEDEGATTRERKNADVNLREPMPGWTKMNADKERRSTLIPTAS